MVALLCSFRRDGQREQVQCGGRRGRDGTRLPVRYEPVHSAPESAQSADAAHAALSASTSPRPAQMRCRACSRKAVVCIGTAYPERATGILVLCVPCVSLRLVQARIPFRSSVTPGLLRAPDVGMG